MKNSTIKPKEKPCKGTGVAIGHGCGKETMHRIYGLCKMKCYPNWLMNTDNGKVKMQRAMIKATKAIRLDSKALDKATRENLKTLSEWKKDLQIEINRIVQAIDKNWPCIATGATTGKRNSGHYISIGSNDTIRFHLENIWNQSEHSNTWKSGDTLRYQDGIVYLYGQEYLNRLNRLKMIHPVKLSIDDLKQKIKIARKILRELRSLDKTYSLAERIELRVKYNLELGIYDPKYCVFEK